MSKPILFVGNGVNLLSKTDSSWSDVINDLAGTPATQHEADVRKNKPFTLWFEELISSRNLKLTKQKVCDKLSLNIKPNNYHKRLMGLGVKHILTTNYDYSLESVLQSPWRPDNRPPERDFSLFRRNVVNGTRIWHMHGEVSHSRTIMLGHGHYSRYVTKICNYLAKGVSTNIKARKRVPFVSRYSKHYEKHGVAWYEDSWVDKFLSSDVHVLGFGFDYTESDIWHLLTVKRDFKKRGRKVGKTIYHRCSPSLPNAADEAKHSLLKSFGVDVKAHDGSSYAETYDSCLHLLEQDLERL